MKEKSFTELHNMKDMLREKLLNEISSSTTNIEKLLKLQNEYKLVKKAIRKKVQEVTKKIQKESEE